MNKIYNFSVLDTLEYLLSVLKSSKEVLVTTQKAKHICFATLLEIVAKPNSRFFANGPAKIVVYLFPFVEDVAEHKYLQLNSNNNRETEAKISISNRLHHLELTITVLWVF